MAGIFIIGFSIPVGEMGTVVGSGIAATSAGTSMMTTLRLFGTFALTEAAFGAVGLWHYYLKPKNPTCRVSAAPTPFDYGFPMWFIAAHTFELGLFLPSLVVRYLGCTALQSFLLCAPTMLFSPVVAVPGGAALGLAASVLSNLGFSVRSNKGATPGSDSEPLLQQT